MKKIIYVFTLLIALKMESQIKLIGTITNKITHEPLPGAIIYFPDLKSGAISKSDGSFEANNLPSVTTLVQVKLIGYKTIIQMIDLSRRVQLNCQLDESIIEENEIVVTGVSKATEIKKSPVPMAFIDSKYLEQNSATNVIDALVRVPGINALSTGPNVSKPFIRGLGYNRILTLFDGVRQEGQQWGDEHGIEVDQYLIDRIEVVKGPASLIYGSDALAGVVNLLPSNPLPEGIIKGSIQSNYQTNNGLRSTSANCAGNTNGFIWGIRGSYKEATNFKNKYDGRVYNTGFKESDLNSYIGINRKWGYSHLTFSLFDNLQEIPDGSRDSVTRKFTKQITELDSVRPIVSNGQLNSYEINPIHQRVQHYRLSSTNNFIIRKSKLALRLGYQQSVRREFAHPEMPDIAGLYLKMRTATYDVKYYFPEKKGWEGTAGLNGMYQVNNTDEATEFVIPDYNLFDFAPFIYTKKNSGKWDFAFGGRYDTRSFQNSALYTGTNPVTGFDMKVIDNIGAVKRFDVYNHSFSGFSGSFGSTYNITNQFLIKINVARGIQSAKYFRVIRKGSSPRNRF